VDRVVLVDAESGLDSYTCVLQGGHGGAPSHKELTHCAERELCMFLSVFYAHSFLFSASVRALYCPINPAPPLGEPPGHSLISCQVAKQALEALCCRAARSEETAVVCVCMYVS